MSAQAKTQPNEAHHSKKEDGVWISNEDFASIVSAFSEMNQHIDVMESTLERADSLVKVIEGISSKTDLLALNASIEAARAGKAGKGFAVVADDVSKLSEKTQSSIEEVKNVLLTVSKNIEKISQEIESGKKKGESLMKKGNSQVSLVK